MIKRVSREQLVEVIEGDREIVIRSIEEGVLEDRAEGYDPREVERVLVARTLVRELDVNWAGVDIILRLREDLLATRRQVAELLEVLQRLVDKQG